MPGILGVAEPKRLGGRQRVNQKRWSQPWFLLHQGQLAFPFSRDQCSGLLCASSGFSDWPLICFLHVLSRYRASGRRCVSPALDPH